MKVIDPYYEIINMPDGKEIIRRLEQIGRVCYKDEDRIEEDSATKF